MAFVVLLVLRELEPGAAQVPAGQRMRLVVLKKVPAAGRLVALLAGGRLVALAVFRKDGPLPEWESARPSIAGLK